MHTLELLKLTYSQITNVKIYLNLTDKVTYFDGLLCT